MLQAISSRVISSLLVIVGSLTLVFCIFYLLPGDPVLSMVDPTSVSPEVIENLRHQLGLDRPFHERLLAYFGDMLTGDFGRSIVGSEPVLPKILAQVPATLLLTAASALIAVAVGVSLGVLSAVRKGGIIDFVARVVGLFGISMPTFWSGILLILIFSVQLRLLPAMGSDGFATLILPAVALGFVGAGSIVRMVRGSMLDVLNEPFVTTLRAKGLREGSVNYKHALRSALIPAVTLIGMQIGDMLAGTVIIETVFSRQGVGRILADAIMAKDLPVVQGIVFFTAILYVGINLLVDLSYAAIDPRVRRKGA
ncbi:ABC transporter permease [Saccharibacillus sp. CPCC 101409]|uniref:ABC transporter permease n=1 Tax=Saccharibacillus sp. CPCC 101409 TaxID=3058041 RepID=UPI002673072F|nr:ABC transporter permease [Saccharibacillus sp. CPCC 101409]MDO3413081.1 ABC transporter permease [Saccharibacillus sp. CPCC 101409]